jgi:hypothetical protein
VLSDQCLKQDFVRIDVPNTGDDLLIHQDRLDIALHPGDRLLERRKIAVRIKRVAPEFLPGDKIHRIVSNVYAPDHSFVGIGKVSIVCEVEAHPREGRLFVERRTEVEGACQPEMQGQPTAMIEPCQQVLAVTA